MRLPSIASLLLVSTTLLLPGIAAAQRTADESLQGITAQAHFRIRASELCRQPDEAQRQEMASKILGWINAEAARVGASPAALAAGAQEGVRHAESRLGATPSADACEASTRQFTIFFNSMVTQRESQQSSMLEMHSRVHMQLRVAELCGDPDETKRVEMAARLDPALAAFAAEAGVLPDLLAKNAAEAARTGELAYAQNPSAEACRKNAASLISLGGG